jgi:hypothetical protein
MAAIYTAKNAIGEIQDKIAALRADVEGAAALVGLATGGFDSQSVAGQEAAGHVHAMKDAIDGLYGLTTSAQESLNDYASLL